MRYSGTEYQGPAEIHQPSPNGRLSNTRQGCVQPHVLVWKELTQGYDDLSTSHQTFLPEDRQFRGQKTLVMVMETCGQHLGNEERDGCPAAMGSPSICPLLLGPFSLDLPLPALEKLVPVFKLCSESHCKNSAFSTRENSTTPGNHWYLQSHGAAWLCISCRGSGSCAFILGQMWNKRNSSQRFVPTDINSKQIRIQAVQKFTKTLETSANKFSNILYLEYLEQIAWGVVLDQSLLELCWTWNHLLKIYLNLTSYEAKISYFDLYLTRKLKENQKYQSYRCGVFFPQYYNFHSSRFYLN